MEPAYFRILRLRLGTLERGWTEHALCRGSDTQFFFPTRGDQVGAQKAICRGCPVKDECLEYAMAAGEKHGIWGGLSERERRQLRRRRQRAALKAKKVVAA